MLVNRVNAVKFYKCKLLFQKASYYFGGVTVPKRGTVNFVLFHGLRRPPTLPGLPSMLRNLASTRELTGTTEGFQAGSDVANLLLGWCDLRPERARTNLGRPVRGK